MSAAGTWVSVSVSVSPVLSLSLSLFSQVSLDG